MRTVSPVRRHLLLTLISTAGAAACALALPLVLGGGLYARDVVQVALVYALLLTAWDLMCGLTGEVSFGHSLFVGTAAYGAALAQSHLGLGPLQAALVGAAIGSIAGLFVGVLTLEQTGAVFAMVTMATQLTFHRALFVWSGFFGGEEGIPLAGKPLAASSALYWLTAALAVAALLGALVLRQTSFGRQLRASGGDTRLGLASGVAVPRVRVAGLTLSAFLAGVGGVLLTQQHMLANQELAGDSLSCMIFLLAVIGGAGTLIGPWFAAIVYFCCFRQITIHFGRAEPVIVSGVLLLLIWVAPEGLGNVLGRLLFSRASHTEGPE